MLLSGKVAVALFSVSIRCALVHEADADRNREPRDRDHARVVGSIIPTAEFLAAAEMGWPIAKCGAHACLESAFAG